MKIPNKDEIQGDATRAGGKFKENVGRLTEDVALENECKAEQVKGNIQEGFGRMKRNVKDAFNQTTADISDADKRSLG